ncbi:hypothetical protein QEN19_000997 [Hanseniaspora menglaensis]
MVPFAGYSMPVLYKGQSQVESHNWTRTKCGIFDVSHMLQSYITGVDSVKFLHKVTPTDFTALQNNSNSLTVLLNEDGGVVDDSIVTKENAEGKKFYVVTNAGCIDQDTKFINGELEKNFKNSDVKWEVLTDRSLFAIQGPLSQEILSRFVDGKVLESLFFGQRIKNVIVSSFPGLTLDIARSGYTGEDGFEISISTAFYESFIKKLLEIKECKMIGLAARDSLRLEAGMCLYGHELNEKITPVEASLSWLISKPRRAEASFNGAFKIMDQLKNKTHTKLRTGFKFLGKGPAAREETPIFKDLEKTEQVGVVTSGSPSPSLGNINIGQAYLNKPYNKSGTKLFVSVGKKGKLFPIEVVKLPFVESKYYKQ